MTERHVLGLSGGRDSAALAIFMRQHHPEFDIEYFFTDTGKELPEVYEFLGRLEGFLGKPVIRLNPDRDFDFWLTQYKSFLPSPKTRWCTRQLKIRPFEEWVRPSLNAGDKVTSYVAIRADEDYREGYSSTHANLHVRLPFRESGVDKPGVIEILEVIGSRVAGLLSMALAQRLHLLFLSAEDRVGAAHGGASGRVRGRQGLREERGRARLPLHMVAGGVIGGHGVPRTDRGDPCGSRNACRATAQQGQTEPVARYTGNDGH